MLSSIAASMLNETIRVNTCSHNGLFLNETNRTGNRSRMYKEKRRETKWFPLRSNTDDLLVEKFFFYTIDFFIRKYSVLWTNNDRIDARVYKITVTWRKEQIHICQRTIKFKASCIFHNHSFSFFSFLFAQLASISGRKFTSSPLYIVLLIYLLLSGIFLFFKISWNVDSIGDSFTFK